AIHVEQHLGAGQCRVATQWHLSRRGEPADMPGVGLTYQKRRLRQVVFGGDVLHLLVRQPVLKAIDDRRIARKGAVAEGIDLMERQGHGSCSKAERDCTERTWSRWAGP